MGPESIDTFTLREYPIPQSPKYTERQVKVGAKLARKDQQIDGLVFINGVCCPHHYHHLVTPKAGTYVVVRRVQGDPVSLGLALFSAYASASAVAAGITWAGAAWLGASMLATVAASVLSKPPEQNIPTYTNPKQSASIEGAQNSLDPFGTIDKIYGRIRTIPKLGGKNFTEITADDQFLRMLLVVGHGPLKIEDIRIGDTPITEFQDYEIETREGWDDDDPVTLYKQTVSEQNLSVVLNQEHYPDLDQNNQATRTTPVNTEEISIDLVAPQGIGRLQGDGSGVSSSRIGFRLELSEAGQNNWYEPESFDVVGGMSKGPIYYDGGSINSTFYFGGKTRNTLRGGLSIKVESGQYDVRLTRLQMVERDNLTASTTEEEILFSDVTWTALRALIDSDGRPVIQSRKPLALIALKIKATDQLNGTIDNLSCIATSYLRDKNGDWVLSSNPAMEYRDGLIGNGGKTAVELSRVDQQRLAEWEDRCTAKGYEFNAKVRPATRFDVLKEIAANGRASFHMNADLYSVVIDGPRDRQKTVISTRNTIVSNASASRSFQERPHALRTQYIDPRMGYEQNEVIVYREGYNKDGANGKTAATEFETFDVTYGTTDRDKAIRLANEQFGKAKLQNEEFTRDIPLSYLILDRGDRVGLADPSLLISLGDARILTVAGTYVELDNAVSMDQGEFAAQIVASNGDVELVDVVTEPGETYILTLQEPAPANVKAGDLLVFGRAGLVTQDVIVKDIEPGAEGMATLRFLPYAPEILDGEDSPDYDAVISQPVDLTRIPPAAPVISNVRSDEGVLRQASDGSLLPQIEVTYQFPSNNRPAVREIEAQWREEDGQWQSQTFPRNARILLGGVTEGERYDIRLRSISIYSTPSEWMGWPTHTVIGKTTVPPTVQNFSAVFEEFAVRLTWDRINLLDIAGYEIEQQVEDTWLPVDTIAATNTKVEVLPTDGQAEKAYPFRIRAVDTGRRVSADWTYTTATVGAPPQPSLSYKFDGPDLVLNWSATRGEFPISEHRIYRDGELVDSSKTTTYRTKADWGGAEHWGVSTIDVAGNEGPIAATEIVIESPSVAQKPAQVIDNNVMLRWTGTRGSLPIERYAIRKGEQEADSVEGTFSTIFETDSGTYVYTVVPIDTAGNEGAGDSRSVFVNQPPDFVLQNQFASDFSGSGTNTYVEGGALVLPVANETWEYHFTSNNWDSPQDQIDAGFPIYSQPSPQTGTYTDTYDCGTVIPSSRIDVAASTDVIAGDPELSVTIEVRASTGDSWETFEAGQARVYATNFRYVRVTVEVTTDDGTDLLRLRSLQTVVSTKLKSDQGTVTVSSNPTAVDFNTQFIDVDSIVATLKGTTSGQSVIYDFVDAPNPTGFELYVFDENGNPTTGTVSWQARGS